MLMAATIDDNSGIFLDLDNFKQDTLHWDVRTEEWKKKNS